MHTNEDQRASIIEVAICCSKYHTTHHATFATTYARCAICGATQTEDTTTVCKSTYTAYRLYEINR